MHAPIRCANQIVLALAILVSVMPAAHAADAKPAAKSPEAAKPVVKNAVLPAAAIPRAVAKAPAISAPKSTLPVPGGIGANDFAQIQQMRDMKQIKEMGDAMRNGGLGAAPSGTGIRNPAGTNLSRSGNRFDQIGKTAGAQSNKPTGYGDPFGGIPMPALPNNRDKHRGGANLMPSGNLRDHASGIAGQDARQRSSHGSLVGPPRQERTSDLETGTRTTTETRLYEDGYSVVESTAQHRDGSSSHITTRVDLDANQVERVSVHKDAQGNVDKDIITGPIDGTQDPNADTNSGGGCNPITGVCHSKPATDPNRVNPGPEGAVPTAGAPMLRVDQRGLVGDPDMVRRNGNGTPRMLEPGNPMNRVNPPGPSDGP